MAECAFCQKKIGLFEKTYKCHNCGETYCDDHCCNHSYLKHLTHLDPVIDEAVKRREYLCVECLRAIQNMPEEWEESIVNRVCSHPGCTERLDSILTVKKSCKICGRLYCSEHCTGLNDYNPSWLKSNLKFELAEAVCKTCGENSKRPGRVAQLGKDLGSGLLGGASDRGRELLYEGYSLLQNGTEKIEEKIKQSYILYGIRVILLALSVAVLITVCPRTFELFNAPTIKFVQIVWSLFLIVIASVFVMKEFFLPALTRKSSRSYAIALLLLAIVFVSYWISINLN